MIDPVIDTEGLTRFRDRKPAPPPWQPMLRSDLPPWARLLAFDASLANTGWVALSLSQSDEHDARVVDAGMCQTGAQDGPGGHEESLRRALVLRQALRGVLRRFDPSVWTVVHETPPAAGPRLHRPESALLACLALRVLAEDFRFGVAVPVDPRLHKRVVGGNPNATKAEEHAALGALAVDVGLRGMAHITNVDKRDALCVGLAHLYLMRRGERR